MRVALVGGKGQLGRDLVRSCPQSHEIMAWDLPELDIRDYTSLNRELYAYQPHIVINAAAYTNVEQAEEAPEAAFACNEYGARNVAAAAQSLGAPVVYYSTDFVFDGQKPEPYDESDTAHPINIYGKSKRAGELATARTAAHHLILRTAWLFGPGGANFIEKMLERATAGAAIRVVEDEIGSPTHTWDLAQATWQLCETDARGLFHVVNEGGCSRFELTKALFDLAGLKTVVTPCSARDFPTKARRPAQAVLSTDKLRCHGLTMRPWRDALEHYLQRRHEIV